ncbi:ABC transporter permease [Pontibacter silvestris]|uniref:ABC transporter permease n=1 Tax=Pontibacter silvestris TaxID=2305183 RepID=A0ABW4WTE9_9BACT|nr:ABC transporter permease [Pontibacter silvestris]MCC9137972.1 ABC transporter permease [Pontibacter silvestris]
MNAWLKDIHTIWQTKFGFRAALIYLLSFIVISLLLPFLPLPYQPNVLDLEHIFQPPFNNFTTSTSVSHWLGTDGLGRDVFSNMLYGGRTALFISLPVMVISTIIGITLGLNAGYYGDKMLKISRASVIVLFIALACSLYYGLHIPLQAIEVKLELQIVALCYIMLGLLLMFLFLLLHPLLKKFMVFQKVFALPLDTIIIRLTEVLTSIPRLIFILALASFVPPSITLLSGILVLTYWTGTARLARAEVFRLKEILYVEAGVSLGFKDRRLLWKHVLPNMLSPIVVAFTFGLASLMTLESTLSFLGIGVPTTLVSWGRTISGIRSNTSAWWLVVFPGAFLGVTVLALQVFSYYILSSFKEKKQM